MNVSDVVKFISEKSILGIKMAQGMHKTVLVLIIAATFVLGDFDRSRDAKNDRQTGKLLAKGAKYSTKLWRFFLAKRVLVKDAKLYDKNVLFVKYRKVGGKERADLDFYLAGPYKSIHGQHMDTKGNIVKTGDIGGYNIMLKHWKTDGAPKYSILMSKKPQFEGIQIAPVIQVDYI